MIASASRQLPRVGNLAARDRSHLRDLDRQTNTRRGSNADSPCSCRNIICCARTLGGQDGVRSLRHMAVFCSARPRLASLATNGFRAMGPGMVPQHGVRDVSRDREEPAARIMMNAA